MFIQRRLKSLLEARLKQFPAVVLLGPRQVGKTTLAEHLVQAQNAVYLDLEAEADRAKLQDPVLYLTPYANRLVILDEVHRTPELFQVLRGLIDAGRKEGLRAGRFLLLGSAALDLLRQSGESLAGRVAYLELEPFDATEVNDFDRLWLRGGFPESYLADNDELSLIWRQNFIRTYLERDIPQFGPRIPAETLRRFWTMLAHLQGGLFNASELGRALGVDAKTVSRYVDLLVDLLLVRRLPPFHANVGKRLVKAPKLYVRDSGLTHALLGLKDRQALLGHPVAGGGWEGFVIENLLNVAPEGAQAYFYRTSGGAEVDLLLQLSNGKSWAVEVKRNLAPKVERGFHETLVDLQPERSFVVYPGVERFPLKPGTDAISLPDLMTEIKTIGDYLSLSP